MTRTFTVTDACGKTNSAIQTININDTESPTFTVPANITIECDQDELDLTLTGDVSDEADNCSIGLDASYSDSVAAGACANESVITRTWTLTDDCINTTTYDQTITIVDTTAPTFTVPADLTINCEQDELDLTLTGDVSDEADNCSAGLDATYSDSVAPGSCANESVITRTWTLVDECTNTTTTDQIITVVDIAAPTFTVPADLTIECDQDEFDLTLTGDVSDEADNCSTSLDATYSDSVAAGLCANESVITRTWTLVDDCSNTTTYDQTITIVDTTAPTFTVPADITIECDQNDKDLTLTGDVTDEADNCSTGLDATYSDSVAPGSCASESVITRTWTLVDDCGNTTTADQTINIVDTTPPTFIVPSDITIECDEDEFDVQVTGNALDEKDNCSTGLDATYTDSVTPGACVNESVIIRTWTLTDDCGNTTTADQTITIVDSTNPTASDLPDITIECIDDVPAWDILDVTDEADNCTANPVVAFVSDVSDNNACAEVITRSYSVTDECGNSIHVFQTITVNDTTPPTLIGLPAENETVDCGNIPDAPTVTATDNCDPSVTVNYTDVSNSVVDGCGEIVRRWDAQDTCGNISSFTQTITVVDNIAPTFDGPTNITISMDENCEFDADPSITGDVTNIIDNCDPNPTATYVDGDCFGTQDPTTLNAGSGSYFYFNISGLDNLTASDIEQLVIEFRSNQGKGNAEFTLVAPSGQGIILVGPYCSGGECEDGDGTNFEIYAPTFFPNSSGELQWDNNNAPQGSNNYTPYGGSTSENAGNIIGMTNYVDSFEELTGTMNGQWFVFSRKSNTTPGNIGFDSVCLTPDIQGCENDDIIIRHWTVTDACNNDVQFDQVIQVVDDTAPVLNLPADETVECDAIPEVGTATATDNCDSDVEITYDGEVRIDGNCPSNFTLERTWTATDNCGNSSSMTQIITVEDTIPPAIDIAAADASAECDGSGNSSDLNDWLTNNGGASASDICGTVTWSHDFSALSDDCGATGSALVTFTATDDCGNSSTTSATFTIVDTTAPTFTAPADLTIECDQDENDLTLTGEVTDELDNCSIGLDASFSDSVASGACANESVITRTWSLTDDCGNTTTHDQTITIVDTTTPTFTVPADVTIECDQDENDLILTGDVSDEADNCSTGLDATYSDSVAPGVCANESIITRTWTLTDDCGNTTTADQTITVVDTTAPTFTAPADLTIECDQDELDLNLTGDVSDEADNCSTGLDATYSDSVTPGECANESVITRTWSLTDDCGNTTTADQTITVVDTTAPVIDTPAGDIIVECDPNNTTAIQDWLDIYGGASATDNCGDVTWSNDYNGATSDCSEPVLVTFTATDACGNSSSTSATYAIQDTTAPTIDAQASDASVECDGAGNTTDLNDWLTNNGGASASDDCSAITWSNDYSALSDDCGATGSATVTFTATDGCGNASSTSATFAIVDTLPPTFTAPASLTIECDQDENDLILIGDVSDEADNCSTGLDASYSDSVAPGACASESVITRTWSLTDDCGNTTTADQTITVVDTTPPTFTAPADLTIECDQDELDLNLTGDVTDEADNCSTGLDAIYSDSVAPGECANESVITRTWRLTDDCGNTTTADQTINIVDTTAPVIDSEASDVVIECDPNNSSAIQDWLDSYGGASATDNCGDVTWSNDYNGATSDCSEPVLVTFTATDACGNSSSTSATYAIQDTTAPTIDTQASDASVECDGAGNAADLADWLANNGGAVASDDCSAITWSNDYSALSDDCGATGSATVTFTATDGCGNSSSTSATFAIVDTTPPTFTAPVSLTIECDQDENDLILTGDVSDEADNCSTGLDASYSDSVAEGECASESVITRTWSLTDDCGNTTTADQTITVVDSTPPTFTAPADLTIECDQDQTDLNLTGDVSDEADNCSAELDATYSDSTASGECANESIITRTWTLTDDCGNTTTADQTITVVDTTPPTFTAPADVTIECDQDENDMTLTGDVTDETDNCSSELDATYTDSVATGDCANESVITRTWTLTDDCGNTTTADQTITVVDTTPPTFTVPADLTIDCDQDENDLSLTGDVTDETDNCSMALEATFVDSITPGECSGEFIILRTWTLVDDCGNTTSLTQTILQSDISAPTFNDLPADITVECDDIPDAPTLTATDNCNGAILSYSEEETAGDCPGNSTITRTWTAVDGCGNTNTHTQIVTVQDTTPPALVGEFDDEISANCESIPEAETPVFEDACSSDITVDYDEETIFDDNSDNYQIIRYWTATDECGNATVVTQTVTITNTLNITGSTNSFCPEDLFFIDLFDFISGEENFPDGEWQVTLGDLTLGEDGNMIDSTTLLDDIDEVTYIFTYVVTDGDCSSEIDVVFNLDAQCDEGECTNAENIFISKAVTGNGDQWNECFEVKVVVDGEDTPIDITRNCGYTVEVQIFNRWGAKIYENFNYDSETNCWNGTSHSNSVGSSGKVPTGTYYYIVNLKGSGLKPFSGPIYVGTK